MGPVVALPIFFAVAGGATTFACGAGGFTVGGAAFASGLASLGLYWYYHGGDNPTIKNLKDEFTKAYETLSDDEKELFEEVMKKVQKMAGDNEVIRTFMKACSEEAMKMSSVCIDEEGKENPETSVQVNDIESQKKGKGGHKTRCTIKDRILKSNRQILALRANLEAKEIEIKNLVKEIEDLKKEKNEFIAKSKDELTSIEKKAKLKIKDYKKKNKKLSESIVVLKYRVSKTITSKPGKDTAKPVENQNLDNETLHQIESESETESFKEDERTLSSAGLSLTSGTSFSRPSEASSEKADLLELKESLITPGRCNP